MATLEQVIAGLIEFRDETYLRLEALSDKIDNLEFTNHNICTMCHGVGVVIPSHNLENATPASIECPSCSGLGKLVSGDSVEKY